MAYTGPEADYGTFTVPGVLGGELVLGGPMNQGGPLAGLVRAGSRRSPLSAGERMDLRQAEISEKIGIPHRTLTRRLPARAPDRANPTAPLRLAQVFATAAETLGTRKSRAMAQDPNRTLRGGRPLDQLDTDPGVREVEDVLGASPTRL